MVIKSKCHCTRHRVYASDDHSHHIKFTMLWNSFYTLIFDGRSHGFLSILLYSQLSCDGPIVLLEWVSVVLKSFTLLPFTYWVNTTLRLTPLYHKNRVTLLQDWHWMCAFKENWLYIMKSFFPDLCHAVEQKKQKYHINLAC